MRVATHRSRAVLSAILFAFAASFFASEPASAAVRYVRHCYWSHGYRHCHYHRYYYHRHHHYRRYYYHRHHHYHSYCYYHPCYYRHGWNSR